MKSVNNNVDFENSIGPWLGKTVKILEYYLQERFNKHNLDLLMKLYAEDAILVPAFSSKLRRGKDQIRAFYKDFFEKDDVSIMVYQVSSQKISGLKVDNGMYVMRWKNHGLEKEEHIRFSLVIKDRKIVTDHSSIEPVYSDSIDSLPKAYRQDYA